MNLQQAKALFFAQYLGQKIQTNKYDVDAGDTMEIVGDRELKWHLIDIDYLLLRSVNQLTDEECINLASIVGENPFNRYRNMVVTRDFKITGFPYIAVSHKNIKQRFNIDCTHINFSMYELDEDVSGQIDMKPYACIDYLRSIGILLPFTYLDENNKPITLQPDEIIALGWAKIK